MHPCCHEEKRDDDEYELLMDEHDEYELLMDEPFLAFGIT